MNREAVEEQIQKLRNDIDGLESQLNADSMCDKITESFKYIPRGSIDEVKLSEFGTVDNPQWSIVIKPRLNAHGSNGIFSHESFTDMMKNLNLTTKGFEVREDGYLIITVATI